MPALRHRNRQEELKRGKTRQISWGSKGGLFGTSLLQQLFFLDLFWFLCFRRRGTIKKGSRSEKNEGKDQNTENIILPRAPRVGPKNHTTNHLYDTPDHSLKQVFLHCVKKVFNSVEDLSVAHFNNAACRGSRFWIVGDHDESLAIAQIEFLKRLQHDLGVIRV